MASRSFQSVKQKLEFEKDVQSFPPKIINLSNFIIWLVNFFINLRFVGSYLFWLVLLVEFYKIFDIFSKSYIISSKTKLFAKIRLQIFIEIILLIGFVALTVQIITNLQNIFTDSILSFTTPSSLNWQLILAIGLLSLGIKAFFYIRGKNQNQSLLLVRDNYLWLILIIGSFGFNFSIYFDGVLSLILLGFLGVQSFTKISKIIRLLVSQILLSTKKNNELNLQLSTALRRVKSATARLEEKGEKLDEDKEAEVNTEPDPEIVLESDKNQKESIEVFDISDEVMSKLEKIFKVKKVYNTLVCKIGEIQEIVSLSLVVDNNINQEEIFNAKVQAKQILKEAGFSKNVVEVEYEAEYQGLV